jgi:hypothetical protein
MATKPLRKLFATIRSLSAPEVAYARLRAPVQARSLGYGGYGRADEESTSTYTEDRLLKSTVGDEF